MTRNIKYFLFSLLMVAVFLMLRHWLDGKREKIQNIDIVRPDMHEGDLHLGTWAQKNGKVLITFRLKRDSTFTYEIDDGISKDPVKYGGKYQLMADGPDNDGLQYTRLVAVSDKSDTIINNIMQITHATKRNVDILILKADRNPGSTAMLFYRLKQ